MNLSEQIKAILLDDSKIDRLTGLAKQFADGFLPAESLPPQLVIATLSDKTEDGYELTICSVLGEFNGPEKNSLLQKMGLACYEKHQIPLAVMLLSEAWRSKDVYRADGTRQYLLPEDDPQREEIISIQVLTLDMKGCVTGRLVERREGLLHQVGEWEPTSRDFQANLLGDFYRGFFTFAGKRGGA